MQANLRIKAQRYNMPDAAIPVDGATQHHLLFCEHPHVYTLGKSGHIENLLVNDARLKELDVSFFKTNRGGDITYHGPRQVVGYPILDLEHFVTDLGKYMRNLEEVIIRNMHFSALWYSRRQAAGGYRCMARCGYKRKSPQNMRHGRTLQQVGNHARFRA